MMKASQQFIYLYTYIGLFKDIIYFKIIKPTASLKLCFYVWYSTEYIILIVSFYFLASRKINIFFRKCVT